MKQYKRNIPMIAITSLPLTVVMEGTQYLFQDWEFAKWIAVAIAIDTILGVWKHLIHKDASSESFFSRFTKKIIIYMFLMILSNFASHATVHGNVVSPMQWMGDYLCVFMMVREVFSIIENIQAIYPILPKNFVKRLKDFNDSGEYIGKTIDFTKDK